MEVTQQGQHGQMESQSTTNEQQAARLQSRITPGQTMGHNHQLQWNQQSTGYPMTGYHGYSQSNANSQQYVATPNSSQQISTLTPSGTNVTPIGMNGTPNGLKMVRIIPSVCFCFCVHFFVCKFVCKFILLGNVFQNLQTIKRRNGV